MVAIPKCIAKVIHPKYYNQFGKRLRKNLWAVGCAIRLFGAFAQIHRVCKLWAEIEAHKWCDLELNLSKTATKAMKFY